MFCQICGNLASETTCSICNNLKRDKTIICVVEEAKDIIAIEKTRSYRGVYHVLGRVLDLIDSVESDELNIAKLLSRLADTVYKEVIAAD